MATHDTEQNPLNILFRDEDYIAIDKPAGLLVHRSNLDAHATAFALQILRDQIGQTVYPCHRLDRPTSGILLFALNPEANAQAQNVFMKQAAVKTYQAVVRGWADARGSIDYDLRSEDNPDRIQSAQTEYSCLSQSTVSAPVGRYEKARFSLLELKPQTGRKHQLRRHLAHIRHPILGDTRHGDGAQNRFLREYCGLQMLMLRATQLTLPHPTQNGQITIKAPEDKIFQQVTQKLGLIPTNNQPT